MNKKETVFVCMACGKRSKDRYGNSPIDRGWDESCMLNSVECYTDKLVIANDRVISVEEEGIVRTAENESKEDGLC